jgi:catechol 2,3-dioxygenase-like lactoylglutathione lyase family enzyme
MKASFEVVVLPVSDPDESLRFYRDDVGFDLDVDYAPAPSFRVVQLTPQGSPASIQFVLGLTAAPVGGSFLPGADPERADYASFAEFHDPDGNAWVLQERGHHTERFGEGLNR